MLKKESNSVIIYDGITRKVREIIVPSDHEQVIHHMIVNVLKPILLPKFYEHSYGSIPGRGSHKAKKAIKKAFQNQLDGKGFSLIEVVSTCPTNWGMTPSNALKWLEDNMLPYYPLGVYKDRSAKEEQ